MPNPSPFEPGYQPPAGAELPPPVDPARWGKADAARRESALDESAPDDGDLPQSPDTENPRPANPQHSGPTRVIVTALCALGIGLGLGFGIGYFALPASGEESGSGNKVTPTTPTTPTPPSTPDSNPTIFDDPELTPAEENEHRLETEYAERKREAARIEFQNEGLWDYSESGQMVYGLDLKESLLLHWGSRISTNDWVIGATAPQDVTEEVLTDWTDNLGPAAGYRYYGIEVSLTRETEKNNEEADSVLELFFLADDGSVYLPGCRTSLDPLTMTTILPQGETMVVPLCIELPERVTGRWQFSTPDGDTYWHYEQ